MMEIWNKIAEIWAAYGPWIATALIPTIVTGLSLSPKTADSASIVQKVWDKVKTVLDFLSVLTHKDKPGTFQLPFKAGTVIKKDQGTAGMLAILVLTGTVASSPGCSWFSGKTEEVKDIMVECGSRVVSNVAGDLLPAVMQILMTGASSWKEQLIAFGKQFGEEALACVMALVEDRLLGQIPPEGANDQNNPDVKALNRAREFKASHHWKYAE